MKKEQVEFQDRLLLSLLIGQSVLFACGNRTYKKYREVYNVCTFEGCESVPKAADIKGDKEMMDLILSVKNDVIAAEAKYHKTCFFSYVSKSNLKHKSKEKDDEMSSFDAAFIESRRSRLERVLTKERHMTCQHFCQSIVSAWRKRNRGRKL